MSSSVCRDGRTPVSSCRALRVGALCVGLCAVRCSLVASARAQVNMPDPSLIHGKAIPAPELPNGTVTVRVVREAIGNNISGQTGPRDDRRRDAARRRPTTQGRAEFPNLPPGVEGRAEATVDGEALVSDPFTVPAPGGLRVILVAGMKQAAERRKQEEAAEAARRRR